MTSQARAHLAMLAFSALVAGSFSLGVLAANHIDPVALTTARFALAAMVVGAMVVWRGDNLRGLAHAPWRYVLLGGTFAAYFVLMFEGLKTAAPVSASAVFTLTPVLSAIVGYLLLRQITTARMALALCIGASGALWVIFRADWAALRAFNVGRGEQIYFVGCMLHAVYTPLVRLLNRGENAFAFSLGTLIAGAGVLALYGAGDIAATDWAALPLIVWATLLYLAVFASAMTFICLQYATMHLPSAKVMAYTYLTPSWVLVWEIALGHGVPAAMILIGVGLTVVALLLLLKDEQSEKTA